MATLLNHIRCILHVLTVLITVMSYLIEPMARATKIKPRLLQTVVFLAVVLHLYSAHADSTFFNKTKHRNNNELYKA